MEPFKCRGESFCSTFLSFWVFLAVHLLHGLQSQQREAAWHDGGISEVKYDTNFLPCHCCPSLQFKNDEILIRSRLWDHVYQLVFVLALVQSIASVREGSCFLFTSLIAITRIWLQFCCCIVKNVPSWVLPGPLLTMVGIGFDGSRFWLLLSKMWRSYFKLPVLLLRKKDLTERMSLKFSFIQWSLNSWSLTQSWTATSNNLLLQIRWNIADFASPESVNAWLVSPTVAELDLTNLSTLSTRGFHTCLDLLSSFVPLSGFQVVAIAERNWLSHREKINSFIT